MTGNIEKQQNQNNEKLSLNDDRRVKVLSPGMLVAKRFFRNRLAVVGMIILIFMFAFSFLGGLISPYDQDQFFYVDASLRREFGAVKENTEYRFSAASEEFSPVIQAQTMLAITKKNEQFAYNGKTFGLEALGTDFYGVTLDGARIGIAYKDIVSASNGDDSALSFPFIFEALNAYSTGADAFSADGVSYTLDANGGITASDGTDTAFISRYIVNAVMPDVKLSRDFKDKLVEAVKTKQSTFTYTDESLILAMEEDGVENDGSSEEEVNATANYDIEYDAARSYWKVLQAQTSRQYDVYAAPSASHWLGTDKYGMDMLTRLMYGGRVSLIIGFIVVFIETFLGVVMGGIAGYFGGWVDNLIMRLVDIFYCIPSTPIIIILGAAMDAQRVDPTARMGYLMLILGVLGWAGVARLVRGQILSLREQEFMTATEACGIRVSKRIFRHLIPNVIPQLIVNCTMGLGSVIITEATLSFLGLGVKFPFASWGNIINDVNNTFVLTTYWFIWIPAGVLLLLTVLAFNIVGDGLRDAFDPKMKR